MFNRLNKPKGCFVNVFGCHVSYSLLKRELNFRMATENIVTYNLDKPPFCGGVLSYGRDGLLQALKKGSNPVEGL